MPPKPNTRKSASLSLPHEFSPRSYQREVFEARDAKGIKRFLTCWHRKSGKDITWWNFLIREAAQHVGPYWEVFPTIEQGKKVIWHGFSKATAQNENGEDVAGTRFLDHIPIALLAKKNDTDHLITLKNGSTIQIIGSDKLDSIVGPDPIGVVFSEYSVQFPGAWEQVASPVLEQNGGWAGFNFTPRGRNHAYKLYENAIKNPHRWFTSLKTIEDTYRDGPTENHEHAVTSAQISQLRAEGQDEDLIQQEYYCSFYGAYAGSYFARIIQEIRKRAQVRDVPYDPTMPVFTVWDLGIADMNAIWFAQVVGRDVRLIDFVMGSGKSLADWLAIVRNKRYVYSSHWAPHDIEVEEYSTGETRKQAAARLGFHFRVVPKLPVDDGIDAVRRILPRCFFDRMACDDGLRCLENYSREQKNNGEYANHPKHDRWSHGADAFRYLALIAEQESSAYFSQPVVETEFEIFDRPKGLY